MVMGWMRFLLVQVRGMVRGSKYTHPLVLHKQFSAFDEGFSWGVDIALCDLNYNGSDEIIVGAGPGDLPVLRVFTGAGLPYFNNEILVFDEKERTGVDVGCGDVDGNYLQEIVAIQDYNTAERHVKIFRRDGSFTNNSFLVKGMDHYMGIDLEVIDFPKTMRLKL